MFSAKAASVAKKKLDAGSFDVIKVSARFYHHLNNQQSILLN
jgi:hypothetical protein